MATETPGPAGTAERPGDHPEDAVLLKNLPYRLRELIPVAAAICLGVAVLIMAGEITDRGGGIGPRFWPIMLAWVLIGLGVLLVFTNVLRGVRPSDIPDDMTWWGVGQMVLTGLVLIGYLLLFNVLQFWLITLVATFLLLVVYGIRSWKVLVFLPLIIGVILHVLFIVLLEVPL
ncbi:tripartite tricarboxylate transporter TctB family protein [Citricoccus nitrophenolicus]|uniref:tripartite tricarboxylate transporter TctB family protein n=1 Tax=Citricoccus nitrophenolicus TaxID=863575 RepID=UPI0031EA797C